MTEFRNAYHFVPRQAPAAGRSLPGRQKEYGLSGHAVADGHAVYAPGTRSGRIICRVTLECPTVIGGKRISVDGRQTHSVVEPFLFRGRPALPATSLKGMISSIAEAISRAPYRVLADAKLTVAYVERVGGAFIGRRFYEGHADPAGQLDRVHDHVDPGSRPLIYHASGRARRPTRSQVSPVEAMFGFVREVEKGVNIPKGTVVSAAGKVRFSHALPSGAWSVSDTAAFFVSGTHSAEGARIPAGVRLVRLKEQGTPMKPPRRAPNHGPTPSGYEDLRSATPNFYFVHRTMRDEFISKQSFAARPGDYAIQGGKFYLHHPAPASEPWRTADVRTRHGDLERKAAVAPLGAGVTFDFHVDFDNLSDHELNILCFALRPSPRFRHKIGLGKALGLGSIRIDILDMVTVDRARRYTAAEVLAGDARHDKARAPDASGAEVCVAAHRSWLDTNDPGARRALLAIGETHRFDSHGQAEREVPVLWVPLVEARFQAIRTAGEAEEAERESYKWFVENDKPGWHQKLRPVGVDGKVPILGTDGAATLTRTAPAEGKGVPAAGVRGTALAAGERSGRLKFVATDRHGLLYAYLIPDDGGADVRVDDAVCKAASLPGARKGALVAFVIGSHGRADRVRLM